MDFSVESNAIATNLKVLHFLDRVALRRTSNKHDENIDPAGFLGTFNLKIKHKYWQVHYENVLLNTGTGADPGLQ